eukprot:CAMPEP_0169434468 /NCGR_PEP_ID=MMETSP1042-20121227/4549_1 /TAXON_ID=464988 /ORGANISM="Hemiselmis andersenii, Strain CCMP1180" /LENGTH=213 /DNA_ID=CAMNT_0009545053 /DNA_START=83 /DNA_END=721 /DNA_ORIENTATION=+
MSSRSSSAASTALYGSQGPRSTAGRSTNTSSRSDSVASTVFSSKRAEAGSGTPLQNSKRATPSVSSSSHTASSRSRSTASSLSSRSTWQSASSTASTVPYAVDDGSVEEMSEASSSRPASSKDQLCVGGQGKRRAEGGGVGFSSMRAEEIPRAFSAPHHHHHHHHHQHWEETSTESSVASTQMYGMGRGGGVKAPTTASPLREKERKAVGFAG